MIALSLHDISKAFGSCVANQGASLSVKQGSVHALVGENGAGKSTLMKIAYGQIRPDSGEMKVFEKPVDFARHSPRAAMAQGIGMVHQHFMLAGPLSVAENAILGREPQRYGLLDLGSANQELRALSQKFRFEIDPAARVEDLSVGEQQRVEILKVLWRGSEILILDEPTAVLTPHEVEHLFEVLAGLVKGGLTVVLITHKLDEVTRIADDITVMRGGKMVAELDGKSARPEQIAQAMVGRPVLLQVTREEEMPGSEILQLDGVHATGPRGTPALSGVSLRVREREIVGIAGVVGNGQSELLEVIAGMRRIDSGSIRLGGESIAERSVAARHEKGIAHIPEDRHARAVILDFSVMENTLLGRQYEFSRRGLIDWDAVRAQARALITSGDVRPTDENVAIRALSGGNQQKVVVGRELSRNRARLLLCGQPTRGVDVGAIESIHRRILDARKKGWGILLVSAELTELVALSDRVLVFYGGRVVAELSAADLRKPDAASDIGGLMTGARKGAA